MRTSLNFMKAMIILGKCLLLVILLCPIALFASNINYIDYGYCIVPNGDGFTPDNSDLWYTFARNDGVTCLPILDVSLFSEVYVCGVVSRDVSSLTIPSTVKCKVVKNTYYDDNGWSGDVIAEYTATVVGFSSGAFEGCNSLDAVNIEDIAAWCGYHFGDNPLLTAHNLYLNGSLVTSLAIPNGVERVSDNAFSACTSILSLSISDSVVSIGRYAFSFCRSINTLSIGNGVSSIGDRAFSGCSGLTSITIPTSVVDIGDYAFDGCANITSATIPEYVMSRGLGIVCKDISKLRRLRLLSDVKTIKANQFSGCPSLTTIEVDPANEHYFVSPVDGCLYDYNQTTLLCCPRDTTSIIIPYGVTKIADYAFADCKNLVSVYLPVTLKTIGEHAFDNCTALSSVDIPDSVTSIGIYAFGGCKNLSRVTIPSGVKALSTTAFDGCDILWTEWYRVIADFAVNGSAYNLTREAGDRSVVSVIVSADMELDDFVMREGKVYDSVLYIHNNSDHAVNVRLPSDHCYKSFKGSSPLTIPAYSDNILTITRVSGGEIGGSTFLVTREELETVQ